MLLGVQAVSVFALETHPLPVIASERKVLLKTLLEEVNDESSFMIFFMMFLKSVLDMEHFLINLS